MKQIGLVCLMASLLFASCNKLEVDEAAVAQHQKAQAEKKLGFPISDNQTWNMAESRTLTIASFPVDMDVESISVWNANPLTDTTAVSLVRGAKSASLSFELPAHLANATLYALCTSSKGDTRVQSFKAQSPVVDFTSNFFVTHQGAPRRAAEVPQDYSTLTWQSTFNAVNNAAQGWTDEYALIGRGGETRSFTNFNELSKAYNGYFPEGHWNNRRLNANTEMRMFYTATVAAGGGEVTVTPIYHKSNAGQMFGYFYFKQGENVNIKTVRKFVFEDQIYQINASATESSQNTYKLVYYDENGNASYTFPAGTQIAFFAHSKQGSIYIDWYAEGEANYDMSMWLWNNQWVTSSNLKQGRNDWETTNHVVYCQRGGVKYIGFEDWTDFDYNDLVLVADGALEDFPIADVPSENNWFVYTYAFEDTHDGDYDLNDVVLQVYREQRWTNFEGGAGNRPAIFVKLAALGAADDLKAYFKDATGDITPLFDGKELHEVLGIEKGSFANTQSINVTQLPTCYVQRPSDWYGLEKLPLTRADFYIVNQRTGLEIHTPASQGIKGSAPYGVCVPDLWSWPTERTSVAKAYPEFATFASNSDVATDWYKFAEAGKTIITE